MSLWMLSPISTGATRSLKAENTLRNCMIRIRQMHCGGSGKMIRSGIVSRRHTGRPWLPIPWCRTITRSAPITRHRMQIYRTISICTGMTSCIWISTIISMFSAAPIPISPVCAASNTCSAGTVKPYFRGQSRSFPAETSTSTGSPM